jgi:uncharacterized protein
MIELLAGPWPWYVAGPLFGLMVPILLYVGNRSFGISSNFRHACAAIAPIRPELLRYDWRSAGGWHLTMALGVLIGGFIAGNVIGHPESIALAASTRADLAALGISDFSGLVPAEVFSWAAIGTLPGFVSIIVGGLLVGFGTAYAAGCTSGHGITGLASFQLPSLVATVGFFVGGLLATHLLLPLVLG